MFNKPIQNPFFVLSHSFLFSSVLLTSTLVLFGCSPKEKKKTDASTSSASLSSFGLNADLQFPKQSTIRSIYSSPNFDQKILQKKNLEVELPSKVRLSISEVPRDSMLGIKQCKPRIGREFAYQDPSSCIVKRTHAILKKTIYEVYSFYPISNSTNVFKLSLRMKTGRQILGGVFEEKQAHQLLKLMKTFKY